jgi:uncharacterized protein
MATETVTTVLEPEPIPAPVAAPGPTVRPEPVSAPERFASVDMLRGFALLGILAMNIVHFGWPNQVAGNPTRGGGFHGLDRMLWVVNHLVFEMKMMTLFSMLFGAGLVLMGERAEARGASLRGVYYRRVFWLIVIGLVHSYLIWDGDILVLYGECGLIIYLFRRWRPRTLIPLGLVFLLVPVPLITGAAVGLDLLKETAARAESKRAAHKTPTKFEAWIHEVWTESVRPEIEPSPKKRAEELSKEIAAHRAGYGQILAARAKDVWKIQTFGFVLFLFWLAGGRMLVGMGLMKLGIFSGLRSTGTYATLCLLGYGLGLPLVGYDAYAMVRHKFSFDYLIHGGVYYNLYGSLLVALGHVGALVLIFRSGALNGLLRRLAAAGRMALSNYLMQSLICTTLFYGYGLGLYGKVPRTGLFVIVVAIWVLQLAVSPWWLERFRFGPAEWLWRSLTYWRLQPMRRLAVEPAGFQ